MRRAFCYRFIRRTGPVAYRSKNQTGVASLVEFHRRRRGGAKNEALLPGRVPHVRLSVHGPKMTRRSPSECFCSIATRLRTRARVLAHGLKALEEPVFGPWSRIPCTGRHQRMRVRLSLRKSGCTLGRTWGPRPEPTTVVVSQNPARSCRPNLDRFGLYRLCVAAGHTVY